MTARWSGWPIRRVGCRLQALRDWLDTSERPVVGPDMRKAIESRAGQHRQSRADDQTFRLIPAIAWINSGGMDPVTSAMIPGNDCSSVR